MAACDWPISYAGCDCPTLDGMSAEDRAMWEGVAAEYLWNFTGRSFGLCSVVLRPCRADCAALMPETFWGRGPWVPYPNGAVWGPVLVGGQWYNLTCGNCGGDACSCTTTHAIALPGPVNSVEEVLIDGTALATSAYRVDDARWLVRLDGDRWPPCQDMNAAPSEADTWQVSYTRGVPVPVGGQMAAGRLACEFAKAACSDPSCALPQRVQTVTRQGVTVAVLDSFEDVTKGRTGIWTIDAWIASVTSGPRPSRVYSVDVKPKGRVTTWTSSTPS